MDARFLSTLVEAYGVDLYLVKGSSSRHARKPLNFPRPVPSYLT